MTTEFKLKLQAWLDGELTPREARAVEAQVQALPEAQALLAELRFTRATLRENEPQYTLPESREFYWSKIERAIQAAEKTGAGALSAFGLGWLRRYWPQLSGAAVAAVVLGFATLHFNWLTANTWEDVENPLAETGTFCFRSEQDQITLVWVYDRAEEEESESDALN